MIPLGLPRQVLGLIGWLAVTFITAAVGATASVEAGAFYDELVRPTWAPPGWVFGPVWTLLYALMAVAAWWVWSARGWSGARNALTLYLVQLAFNALWTWLFFAWQQGGLAFAEVLMLWGLVLATLVAFWRHAPLAGALMLPYLLWVSFATALTWATWQANPAWLG